MASLSITGVAEIVLNGSDLPKMRNFYRDVLGFKVPSEAYHDEPARSALNHLAFEIPPESYDAHKNRLESLGLHPRPEFFPAMNARSLFFDDPEQNELELICYHARPRQRANANDRL